MVFIPHMQEPDDPYADAHWFVVRQGKVLVYEGPEGLTIPRRPGEPPVPEFARHVIGTLRGVISYAVDAGDDDTLGEPEGYRWVPLRGLFGQVDDVTWTAAGRAEQIVAWDRTHRFCGRCGSETQRHPNERARVCPNCRLMQFPRLSPATITLVTRGEREEEVLLAHGRQFGARFYSCIAGFVEPGESLEQCVAREVEEEVGITVRDVRYFSSQPWPFPNSLMIGFQARYASGELNLQESEIVDAGWFTADNLPPHPQGGMSIAGWLIEDWLRRQEARGS
jgi:NAD+ diphosphatase